MKKRTILLGFMGLLFCIPVQSQIYTRYTQHFESNDTNSYTTSGPTSVSTVLFSDGSRSIHLDQNTSEEAEVLLDTIDLSYMSDLQYATLEFMHICKVRAQSCFNPPSGGMLEVRLANTTRWTQLTGSHYDMDWGGGSNDFNLNGFFSDRTYENTWDAGNNTIPANTWWKKERFKLSSFLNGVQQQNRKLIIRFRLPQLRNASVEKYDGWYIDNIVVKASASSMTTPTLHMVTFPNMPEIPYSRDMRIVADISTTALQGMNRDSIYITYKLGVSQQYRTIMTKIAGTQSQYVGYIPFCGYDTIVSYRIMAKDSSTNQNYITYPANESSFAQYRCVRGVANEMALYSGTTSNSTDHPFPNLGDAQIEYVYDQATMQAAGYSYGAITKIGYQTASGGNTSINGLTIKMTNIDTLHTTAVDNSFYTGELTTVFSGTHQTATNSSTWGEIAIDSFYYAGYDLLIQLCYDNSSNPPATALRSFPTAANKGSLFLSVDAVRGLSGCNLSSVSTAGNASTLRPNLRFTMVENQPLKHDLGIDSISSPKIVTSAYTQTPIVVKLRNYGTNTVNGTTIYFKVDDNPVQSFNWTGTIAGLSTALVTITSTEIFTPGFKHVTAWTSDSMTVAGNRLRDHEPYNDTASTTFIACDGPMSGVRQIGGTNANYNTIDEFLEALYRCGVNGPLTVNLSAGIYNQQMSMPPVQGVSDSNTITFRPLDGDTNSVVIRVPATASCALNMDSSSYVVFDGLRFETSARAVGNTSALVRFSQNSHHCKFLRCQFIDSTNAGLAHLVNSNSMNYLTIDRCYFHGGATALQLVGRDTNNLSSGNIVCHSYFDMPKNVALRLEKQNSPLIDSNYFYSTQNNSLSVVYVANCYDSVKITRNRIFSSNGAYGLRLTGIVGDTTTYALIANNMIEASSNSSSGTYNSPVDISDVQRLNFVYNAINLNIPNRTNISSASIGGIGRFANVRILNNIFASTTGSGNYTLNFTPMQDTTFVINHNDYYNAVPYMLNQFNGLSTLWQDWTNYVPQDSNSLTIPPVYLLSYHADLRTYNSFLQGKGISIAEVSTDIEGGTRANPPCIGAFEFPPLAYNFEITELLAPETSCTLSTAEHFKVVVGNTGTDTIAAGLATIQFQMAGGTASAPEIITRPVPPSDTIHITFNSSANLSPESNGADSVFHFRFWTNFDQEVDFTNDTLEASLLALYQLPKLPDQNLSFAYASVQTLSVNSNDSVYWYTTNDLNAEPFHKGSTYTTDRLYRDTNIYVAHFHEQPEIRITEIQFFKAKDGITNPYPNWMNTNTNFAVEVSNLGNHPINIGGDTLTLISSTTMYNNKTYIFPSITLKPYSSVVVQYVAGSYSDSITCYFGASVSPQYNTRLGLLYKRKGQGLIDAVAINGIMSQSVWTNQHIPSDICSGQVNFTSTSAGIRRTNINDNSGNGWTICGNSNRMTLGSVENGIIIVPDNGCKGYRSAINIHVTNVPPINVGITDISVPNEGCSLYNEPVTISLTNLGASTATGISVRFKVGNTTYPAENITTPIESYQTVSYTFYNLADLSNHSADRNIPIKVWVEKMSLDSDQSNDTNSISVTSLYTPDLPNVTPLSQTINYATTATVRDINFNDTLVWYDKNGMALDTGYAFTTPQLYQTDTFYVSGLSTKITGEHLGQFEATSVAGYPSAYHCGIKYRKEQYLITADEMRALGYNRNPIASIAFHLDSVRTLTGSTTFLEYAISIGTTSISAYSTANSWQTVSPVYSRSNLILSNTDKGWVEHKLNSPYLWDGVSNIVIQVCYTVLSPSSSASVSYSTTENTSVIYSHSSTVNQSSATTVSGRSNHRPDIRFGFVTYNCEGHQRPFYVNVIGAPNTDAALLGVANIPASGNNSGVTQPVKLILKNYGTTALNNVAIHWNVDNDNIQSFNWTGNINYLDTAEVYVGDYIFGPGHHCINAYLTCQGDGYASNDTMQSCMLFCFDRTPRTIGNGGYFANFTAAVDALNSCGICDSVTLLVLPGTYNEQILLSGIGGISDTTPVIFKSSTGNKSDVVLNHSASNISNNHVLKFDNISNITFDGITIASTGTSFGNAVVISNSNKLHFTNDSITVATSTNDPLCSAITLLGNVNNLTFINNATNGGYYALSDIGSSGTTQNIILRENSFGNFRAGGICLQNANGLDITHNQVRSANEVSTSMTGISLANHHGYFDLQRNQVVLKGNGNGTKHGIELLNCSGSSQYPIRVFNNMVSIAGNASGANTSSCLYLDNSEYANLYYNTLKIASTSSASLTRALDIVACLNIKTMNNIFSNFCNGYACYVDSMQSVASANYNDYYTNGSNFVYWEGNRADTTALRNFTSMDGYSFKQEPFFISTDDLHLAYSTIVESGQYTNEVTIDIDSNARPQTPRPCVGAHEIPHLQHDISVDNIVYPVLTSMPIENNQLMIIARFYNNGRNTESQITWHAEIVGYPALTSNTETIAQIAMGQYVNDTTYISMPLGMIDTQSVKVCLSVAGDEDSTNNCRTGKFLIYPAYNMQAYQTTVTTSACRMKNVPISITVANAGYKPIPTTLPMEIGYEITMLSQGVQLRNIPYTFRDTVYLPRQLNTGVRITLPFSQNADMYPYDTLMDVRLSVRSWVKLLNDLKADNDTTTAVTVTSKHTPVTPVGIDQTIPYATLTTLNASQSQSRPIRWSKDSTSTPFYAPASYQVSQTYSHPNLLFRDTTFYLSSISSTGCTSYYAPIHVHVNNPLPYDASVAQITEPTAKVYMDYDTVKVRIKNYGSQTLTSTPVKYTVRETNNGSILQIVSETCSTQISPQGECIYKFNTLPNFPNLQNWSYEITAWTDLPNEMTRSNDTSRISVTPINESNYCTPVVKDTSGLDISRVTFARMDNPMSPIGRKYVNFIDFDNPMMDAVELHRGTRDTLMISCENFEKPNDSTTKGFVTVYIDWNRNGVFDANEKIFSDSTFARHTLAKVVTVPSTALLGNSRMRIILEQGGSNARQACATNIEQGEIQDYLVNVTQRPDTDVAIMRILSPDDPIISNQNTLRRITLKVSNLGNTVIDTINIAYSFISDTGVLNANYQWTGSLQPNAFASVTLPAYNFGEGSTEFTAQAIVRGDRKPDNNTVGQLFHRFHVITLIYTDNFEASDMLFAPRGTNGYNQNLWQKGTPNKNSFAGTTSGTLAWVTDSVSPINVYGFGNKSYLYTPLINISQIKPDTIRFNLAANFVSGSYMYMEYRNYLGKWVRVGEANDTLPWYTFIDGFNATHNYMQFQYPLSRISNDFSQEVQLRFVFIAKTKARTHDGCAIDDLEIGRAKRALDAGVVTIMLASGEPRFGQSIAPRVMVKNFGYDTLRTIEIAYHPEGLALPRKATWHGALPPDQSLIYRFSSSPFVVQRTMPDTFSICAYTIVDDDIYSSNDSTCTSFGLIPLQNDAGMISIQSPAEHVVAGDSLPISVRIKNFGGGAISTLPISYIFNNTLVTENIDFVALTGNALQSLESFNYTFKRKVRAPIGNSVLHVFTGLANDAYIYNDSLTRHISTTNNLVDLQASEIILNEYDHNFITVELAIDNLGARRAENFSVSYYFDNDTSTLVTETCYTVIPALSRGYHVFNARLPQRPAPYSVVRAFLSVENDYNTSNDTTETFGTTFTDMAAVKALVEENENSSCRVFVQVKNMGNLITTTPITVRANINGTTLTGTSNSNMYPGLVYNIEMNSQVSKNSNHQYTGTASVSIAYDADPSNNQTSVVERSNFVGLPVAENAKLQLYQNYPNPFYETTGISLSIPADGNVRFFVINSLGEMVYQSDKFFTKGENTITFDKGNLSAGTYFYGIEFEGQRLMRKMIFRK